MSANVCDFTVVRNWVRQGHPLEQARAAGEQYFQHRLSVADKIHAGRLGGAASKGRPRHCGLCGETGHNRSNCPQREEYRLKRVIEISARLLRERADALSVDSPGADVVMRAARVCHAVWQDLKDLAVELHAIEAQAKTSESGVVPS